MTRDESKARARIIFMKSWLTERNIPIKAASEAMDYRSNDYLGSILRGEVNLQERVWRRFCAMVVIYNMTGSLVAADPLESIQ